MVCSMRAEPSGFSSKPVTRQLDGSQTEAQLHEVCRDLLSNPVIEDYKLIVEG